MPTFNGRTIVTMPDTPSASSIEFSRNNVVAASTSVFTGQQQIYDWNASWMEASVSLPPLTQPQAAAWIDFLVNCRGQACVFELPAFLAAFLPAGTVPNGYWAMKNNVQKWSISQAVLYGIQFDIREAI